MTSHSPTPNGAPPEWHDAARRAAAGDEMAAKWLAAVRQALEGRDRIARLLEGVEPTLIDRDDDGRAAVVELRRVDPKTGEVAVDPMTGEVAEWSFPEARMLREDWLADPRRTVNALSKCGAGWGVHQGPDGVVGAHPYGCGSPLCPYCARTRAARRVGWWEPQLQALMDEMGAQPVHLTLTRPRTVGEPLGAALDGLGHAWKLLVDGRGSRSLWQADCMGYLLGTEWPGISPQGNRAWHAHHHVLCVLWPWTDPHEFERWVKARWAQVCPGSNPRAQHMSQIGLKDALKEVLKYPFKPLQLDDDQLCESMVTTKGRRPHRCGGAFHGASVIGRQREAIRRGEDPPPLICPFSQQAAELMAAARDTHDTERPRPLWLNTGPPATPDTDEEGKAVVVELSWLQRVVAGDLWVLLTLGDLRTRADQDLILVGHDPHIPETHFWAFPRVMLSELSTWRTCTQ